MKALFTLIIILTSNCLALAQEDSVVITDTNLYRVIKTDGFELIGKIVQQDDRELYLELVDGRRMYIPQYVIIKVELIDPKQFSRQGDFIGEDAFATRYFLTTNGLPIKKGDHYIQWNLFGPDFQFGIGKNLGVGVMTSWLAAPIIGTFKYSFQANENVHFAVGMLAGTTSWSAGIDSELNGGGVLPFGTMSVGNRKANLAISGGYGALYYDGNTDGRALFSVAGMAKINKKLSIVFDSFIMPPTTRTFNTEVYNPITMMYEMQTVTEKGGDFTLLIPGLRWHQGEGKAFQFGFTGVIFDGEIVPFPIPMVQWFRTL